MVVAVATTEECCNQYYQSRRCKKVNIYFRCVRIAPSTEYVLVISSIAGVGGDKMLIHVHRCSLSFDVRVSSSFIEDQWVAFSYRWDCGLFYIFTILNFVLCGQLQQRRLTFEKYQWSLVLTRSVYEGL